MTKSIKHLAHYSSCKGIFFQRKLYSFHKSRFYLNVSPILPYIPEDRPFNAYEHGEILYKDSDHMSSKGSIKLFQHLKPQLKEALQKESTASSGLQKP